MNAKLFFNSLASVGASLMLAGAAQAQSLFGLPFYGSAYNQSNPVAQCGPRGCTTTSNYGYAPRTSYYGGGYNSSLNYAPAMNGSRGCATPSYGPRTANCICGNGVCSPNCPNPVCQSGRGCVGNGTTLNYGNYGNPRFNGGYAVPNVSPRDTYQSGYYSPRGYGASRPDYDNNSCPAQVAPYRAPRYENGYYPGASRDRDIETTQLERHRNQFDSNRSPFYP